MKRFQLATCMVVWAACLTLCRPSFAVEPSFVALVGGTVTDVAHRGATSDDIANAVILIRGGRIVAVGPRDRTPVPAGATVVDLHGKFVIPGLIDGFCGMQNQAEASAQLYEGVTTIVASGDDRRGVVFLAADPSPQVYLTDIAGSTDDWSLLRGDPQWRERLRDGDAPHELTAADTRAQIDETARRGTRVLWIGRGITSANTIAIVNEARRTGLATYGEFISTPYATGIRAGVGSLLHMTRFELGLAPETLIDAASTDPDGAPGQRAYASVDDIDPREPAVARYGDLIAAHRVALMPTFSLFYAVMPGHRNLWLEPVAGLLDAKRLGFTSDPTTGELPFRTEAARARVTALAQRNFEIDKVLIASHPVVLAASGSTWQGSLPGVSMHTELELLVRAGLTARAALAAATSNYAEQFGWTDIGAIEVGRRADLVVLDRDPSTDIRNVDAISAVYLAGIRVDREGLLRQR